MRLFVAVDIDDRHAWRCRARHGRTPHRDGARLSLRPRVSWVAPDRLHLTLQFMGQVSEDAAAAMRPGSALRST